MMTGLNLPRRLKFVLLFLKEAKKVSGKTKFQKMIFLLNKEKNVLTEHEFKIYTYGPYSTDLSADLDALNQFELIDVEKKVFDTLNSEYIGKQYEYSLTNNGKELIDQCIKEFSPDEIKKIKEIVTKWNNKELPNIISYVYGRYMPRK